MMGGLTSRSYKFVRTQHEVGRCCVRIANALEHLISELEAWKFRILNLMCYSRILLHYIVHNKIMRTCNLTWKYTPLHYAIFFCCAVHRLILFRFPSNTTRTNWLGKHQLAITLSFLHRYGSCNKNDMINGVVHWQCFSNSGQYCYLPSLIVCFSWWEGNFLHCLVKVQGKPLVVACDISDKLFLSAAEEITIHESSV